jgi:hypothetical protein
MSEYEVLAIRYAHNAERRAAENFIGGDPHDGPMPMDFFVWALRGRRADHRDRHRFRCGHGQQAEPQIDAPGRLDAEPLK